MGEVIQFGDHQPEAVLPGPAVGEGERAFWAAVNSVDEIIARGRMPFLEQELIEAGVPWQSLVAAFPLKPESLFLGTQIFNSLYREDLYIWATRGATFDCSLPELPEAYYEIVKFNARREMDGELVSFIRPICSLDGTACETEDGVGEGIVFAVRFSELSPITDLEPITFQAAQDLMDSTDPE